MLSPAIRNAALQCAIDLGIVPTGGPVFKGVAEGYETGFLAGFHQRPQPARFPLSGQREFLRVLAPYVAENIDIYHPATGRYGLLKGLPATYEGQGEPLADVEFYADVDARQGGGGDALEPAGRIVPVLYAFEDLATELTLPDGRRVVPAVEVAKLLPYAHKFNWEEVTATLHRAGNTPFIVVASPHTNILDMYEGDLGFDETCFAIVLKLMNWLRAAHFAVGLRPDQYHRKQVAAQPFEYLTMGEPLPKVTPCPSKRNDCPSGCPKCPVAEGADRA